VNCKAIYAKRTPPEKPPCQHCRAELWEENADAGRVFMICRHQYVTAEQGGVVDISIPAVLKVMTELAVQDRGKCLERVHRVSSHFLRERQKRIEQQMRARHP